MAAVIVWAGLRHAPELLTLAARATLSARPQKCADHHVTSGARSSGHQVSVSPSDLDYSPTVYRVVHLADAGRYSLALSINARSFRASFSSSFLSASYSCRAPSRFLDNT